MLYDDNGYILYRGDLIMDKTDITSTVAGQAQKVIFALSTIFFWVKGSIKVDSRFVKVETKNTILGVIPAGQKNRTFPLKNLQEANLSSSYDVKAMFFGLVILIIGFFVMKANFLIALILMVIGIAVFCAGIKTVLVIVSAGSEYAVDAPFFEKTKMNTIKDAIDEALAYDTDKTDLNLH